MSPSPVLDLLSKLAIEQGCEIVMTITYVGKRPRLRIELRTIKVMPGKVIDVEEVKPKENVENAARRMLARLRKDRVV